MTTNTNVEAMIALKICQAQMASDAGKRRKNLSLTKPLERNPLINGYECKEDYILYALRLIRANKTRFNYWVTEAPDQNGYESIIVYFDFMFQNVRYQVSFHTPENRATKELRNLVNTGRKTRWNKNIDSVDSCKALQMYYGIESPSYQESESERDPDRRRRRARPWRV